MKVGLFFSGLGEAFNNGSAMRYAERLKNEMDYNNEYGSVTYFIHQEQLKYADKCETNCVSIYANDGKQEVLQYRLYDFYYTDFLTKEFKGKNVLVKSVYLLGMVLTKLPTIAWRIMVPNRDGYQSFRLRFQAMYTFLIFLIISLWGLFLLPSVITLITEIADKSLKQIHPEAAESVSAFFTTEAFAAFSMSLVSFSALLYTLVPASKDLLTNLATEFTCVNYYLSLGEKRNNILGNLDELVEFISEREKKNLQQGEELKLHFHAYSFGSIIALDALFPYGGGEPSKRIQQSAELICTIGCPYEFVATYYNSYYQFRSQDAVKKLAMKWYNVYMLEDALSSNFRNDCNYGEAMDGMCRTLIPTNLPYKHIRMNSNNPFNFIMLNSLRVHRLYWDKVTAGQSCLRLVYNKMKEDKYM